MKLYKHFLLGMGFIALSSCDDTENDVTLPSDFNYISFENSELTVFEAGGGSAEVMLTRSTGDIASELTLTYTVATPTNGRPAVEGVDYSLPAGSGTVTFPAGVATVTVPLLNIIDNDDSVGSRSLLFSIDSVNGFLLGSPDFPDAGNILITIAEDDLFTFGETSFEEVTTFVGDITYPKTPTVTQNNTQVLIPSSTDPFVDWTRTTGNELGFDTSSSPDNLIDLGPEAMGVLSNENMDTAGDFFTTRFRNGTNGYVASDLDGAIDIVFDDITIPAGTTNLVLEVSYYMASTYEDTEGLYIYWETADGLGEALVFEQGPGAQIDQWIDAQIPIPAERTVDGRIVVKMFNTFDPETTYLDYIAIKGIR